MKFISISGWNSEIQIVHNSSILRKFDTVSDCWGVMESSRSCPIPFTLPLSSSHVSNFHLTYRYSHWFWRKAVDISMCSRKYTPIPSVLIQKLCPPNSWKIQWDIATLKVRTSQAEIQQPLHPSSALSTPWRSLPPLKVMGLHTFLIIVLLFNFSFFSAICPTSLHAAEIPHSRSDCSLYNIPTAPHLFCAHA